MRPLRAFLVLVVALAAMASVAGGRSGGGPHLVGAIPCPGPGGFDCSTLEVPLDHSGKRRGTLALSVAAGTNVDAPRGVLLQLTGGPGQSGVPYAARFAARLGPAGEQYRIVMFDQRGTGTTALDCPALQRQMGFSDIAPPTAAAVRACARAIGANRDLYGTDDVVADIEYLRRALGARKLTIDGVSYGTYVAERYALAHPDRVARLVLDSVVPHTGLATMETQALPRVARVLRLACREHPCPADPAADLAAVVARYHDGPRLLDALVFLSIVAPTFRGSLPVSGVQARVDVPQLLHDARQGRTHGLHGLLSTVRDLEAAERPSDLSQGLHASALCADWRFPWGNAAVPLAVREVALRGYGARLERGAVWPFDRATATGNGVMRQCLYWPPTKPTPPPDPAAKLPAVPTLLLAGDRDLSTPLPWARQELALAPRGRLVIVNGAGHSVQSRAENAAGRAAVQRFLLEDRG
jgi:pimeloyl-ACP methyl ester carboxylesterase